jgi:penicillin amidase
MARAACSVLPPEYALTEAPPEPWHPEHTLALARLVLFTFALNWDTELLRERLLTALGAERALELDAAYPADGMTATGLDVPAGDRLLHALESAFEAGLPVGGASNAWALSAERSATGAPLLASDPHLQARIPSFFHVAHVAAPGFNAIGAGIAGIPGVVLGHNGELAWGITAGMADVADCYIERLDPAETARYLTPEGWRTGRTRIERIAVRDGTDIEERVLETRHGPVIGPALPGESRAIALRCTALEDGDLATPFLAMLRARTPTAFEHALALWPGSSFNFVWAARSGPIGYRMPAALRARPGGPVRGMARTRTARRPPCHPGDAASSTRLRASSFRCNALGGEAQSAPVVRPLPRRAHHGTARGASRHTVASLQAIQVDLHSAPLLALRELLMGASAFEGAPLALVRVWDGQAAAGSAAAAILEATYAELARTLVTRLAGAHADLVLGRGLEAVVGSS